MSVTRRGRGSPYRRGRFDPAAWRERVRDRLASRFGLRLHMTLLVALVFATAFVTTRGLLALHVTSMALRYAAASITGYAALFGLVRAWLWWVAERAGAELVPEHDPDEIALALDPGAPPRSTPKPEPVRRPAPRVRRRRATQSAGDVVPDLSLDFGSVSHSGSSGGGSSGGGSSGGGGGSLDLDEGIVAILIIAIVAIVAAAIFGAAGYVIYQAPTTLGEAAFELVLASVLARSSRKVTRGGWSGSVLSATWKPALAMMLVATLGGWAVQGLCPSEITLRGAIAKCVLDRNESR